MLPYAWNLEVPQASSGSDGVPSWFDTGARGVEPTSMLRSVDEVAPVAAAASERARQGGGAVVLVGFSQGGAFALGSNLEGVDGVVAVCGFLPELEDMDLGGGVPALVLGADMDENVPAFLGQDAAAVMADAGREVAYQVLPGGHSVSDAAIAAVRAWIAGRWPDRVRISVGLPTERVHVGAQLVSGAAVAEISAAYESLGFDATFVTDHPAPDDRWLGAGGHQALEPTVALATAAAATNTLLLHTHVYVIGYRNPFLAAKALASLDLLSGGRLILGVAAGYLRSEFAAVGAGFEDRGDRLDAILELLPRIWSGSTVTADGADFHARCVTALPVPAQRPHPPIWVGGNSRRAMRRAVRFAQGWSPFPTTEELARATRTAVISCIDDLAQAIGELDGICEQEERERRPTVCFSPFSMPAYLADPDRTLSTLVEEIDRLGQIGVDWVALSVPGLDRSEITERAAGLARELGLRVP